MDHTFRTYIIFYTLRDWDKVKKKKERKKGWREKEKQLPGFGKNLNKKKCVKDGSMSICCNNLLSLQ